MASLRSLLSHTVVYGLSSVLGRTINFILVPFYTGLFSEPEYGLVQKVYAFAPFLLVVYTLGMETTFFRFASDKNHKAKDLLAYTAWPVFLLSFSISLLLFVFSGFIAEGLTLPDSTIAIKPIHIKLMAFVFLLDGAWALLFAWLRFNNQSLKFASVKTLSILLNLGFNFYWLYFCPMWIEQGKDHLALGYDPNFGIGYVFLANLLSNAITALLLLKEWFLIRWKWDWELQKQLLAYGWPLMLMGLAGAVNEVLDRVLLEWLIPTDMYPKYGAQGALGIYAACYKLSIFMALATQAFRYAAEPFFFAQTSNKQAPELFAKIMHYFVFAGLAMFLAVSFNLSWIAPIVLRGEGFRTGLGVVPILLLANLLLGVYFNLSIWYKLTDKTIMGLYFSLLGAAITIIGNLVTVPIIGYHGAAWTTLLAYSMMVVTSYIVGKKAFPIPYNLKILGALFISAMVIFLLTNNYLPKESLIEIITRNLAILIWIGAGIYLLNKHYKTQRN